MSDRFMDGEKQLRRIDDDVVAAGADRFGGQFFNNFVSGFLGVRQPRVVLDVFVAEQLGAIHDRPILEIA
jgi:hypothetical protein